MTFNTLKTRLLYKLLKNPFSLSQRTKCAPIINTNWWTVFREILFIVQPIYRGGYSAYTTGWTIQDSNLGRNKEFFSSPNRPRCLWGPPNLLFKRYRGPSARDKAAGGRIWLLTSIQRWEWVEFTHTPLTCLHGVDRGNVTLCLYLYLRLLCESHDQCVRLRQNADFLNVTAGGVYRYHRQARI